MTNLERDWRTHSRQLANMLALPDSRWHAPVAEVPRHAFIPRWFERAAGEGWQVRDGATDLDMWTRTAYSRTNSVVTKVGAHHADSTPNAEHVQGRPTSSATNPWRVLEMYRAARIHGGSLNVLDVGTGSGYGCAVLGSLLGPERVTTIDVDPYLTHAAGERLAAIGQRPRIITGDATGSLDWEGDRIAAMVAVPAIPANWLAALHTGGRLAANITGTMITVTAKKLDDGSAWGRVEFDYRGGFMHTRGPHDYPPSPLEAHHQPAALLGDGDTSTSRFPVIDLDQAAELSSVLALTAPGISWTYSPAPNGWGCTRLAHPDGSWARAEGQHGTHALVHQGGPRQLWDELDRIRSDWITHGSLRLYGAEVRIEPDGTTHFFSGQWSVALPAADQ